MRSRIVDVASGLFARRGIDGVSISEVALAAGVSKANVMHHFGSKNGLYAACLDLIDAHLHDVVDRVGGSGDPVNDLRASLESWADEHPGDCRVMAYGLLRLPEQPGRWALSAPVERMIELVARDRTSLDDATAAVVDLLGTVTYREMSRPLVEARGTRLSEPSRQENR